MKKYLQLSKTLFSHVGVEFPGTDSHVNIGENGYWAGDSVGHPDKLMTWGQVDDPTIRIEVWTKEWASQWENPCQWDDLLGLCPMGTDDYGWTTLDEIPEIGNMPKTARFPKEIVIFEVYRR